MHCAVIVNPTKIDDLAGLQGKLTEIAASHGHGAPQLVETTEDDPGFGQTRQALAAGASLICPMGGDGTVRAVAAELVGTGVPMGLLPGGTGNLLARNVGAPVNDLADAFEVALTGTDRTIDVGWLILDPTGDQLHSAPPARADNVHCFTVMAGFGFDAQVMGDAPEGLKAKLGWAAYVASGSKHLGDDGFDLQVSIDGQPATHELARTAIVGNCGELTGGMRLLPDAEVDDGLLDLVVLTPENIAQWAGLAARIVAGRESEGPAIDRYQGRDILLRPERPQLAEVDGDVLTECASARLVVQPACLVLRVAEQ